MVKSGYNPDIAKVDGKIVVTKREKGKEIVNPAYDKDEETLQKLLPYFEPWDDGSGQLIIDFDIDPEDYHVEVTNIEVHGNKEQVLPKDLWYELGSIFDSAMIRAYENEQEFLARQRNLYGDDWCD